MSTPKDGGPAFPRYEIATVADFFQVPADRWVPMLRDFVLFLKSGVTGMKAIRDAGSDGRLVPRTFIWIDDGDSGLREVHVSFPVDMAEPERDRLFAAVRDALDPSGDLSEVR